jgi:hypothetical protein
MQAWSLPMGRCQRQRGASCDKNSPLQESVVLVVENLALSCWAWSALSFTREPAGVGAVLTGAIAARIVADTRTTVESLNMVKIVKPSRWFESDTEKVAKRPGEGAGPKECQDMRKGDERLPAAMKDTQRAFLIILYILNNKRSPGGSIVVIEHPVHCIRVGYRAEVKLFFVLDKEIIEPCQAGPNKGATYF